LERKSNIKQKKEIKVSHFIFGTLVPETIHPKSIPFEMHMEHGHCSLYLYQQQDYTMNTPAKNIEN